MNHISVRFRTNLDLAYEKWPSYLPVVPAVGDYIQSGQVWDNRFQLTLEVYSVTWVHFNNEWIPEIELHIRKVSKMSITDFYNWYAPKVGRSPSYFI